MENKTDAMKSTVKAIIDAITKDDFSEFQKALAQHKGNVDLMDENGMTPLHHAAFKGNKEMVQSLLDRGADVSEGNHEYGYTSLHFGALSGNSDVCQLLLDAGAIPTIMNTMGRSAAQMAAFVGNYHTVSTINSFVPRSEIAFYTVKQENQTEPVLTPFLLNPLHKFVLGINIHPIRLALNVQNIPGIFNNALMCSNVFELLCKSEMSRGGFTNEVQAFKYHYLSYLLKQIDNAKEKQKPSSEHGEKKHEIIEMFAKRLLKPGKDGVSLDTMDMFLKDCVREFPYRECTTFVQMVTALTSQEPPPALAVIDSTINGQRGFADFIPHCSTCGEEKPAKKCSKCKTVQYCDRECQRLHWFVHKKSCSRQSTAVPSASTPTTKVIDAKELSAELQNLVAG